MPLVCGLLGVCGAALVFTAPGILAVLGAGVVIALSAVESEAFLLFVVFLMPFGLMLPGDTPIRAVHVAFHGLVVAGFFLGRLVRRNVDMGSLTSSPVSRASLLFLLIAVVPTILVAERRTHESMRAAIDLITYVGFYFLVVAWSDTRERIRKVQYALLVSTILTALYAIYQILTGGYGPLWSALYPPGDYQTRSDWVGRSSSILATPGNLAGYLDLVLPFALGLWVCGQGRWRKLGAWTFGLGVMALFSTQGLGGIMGFVAFLALAIFRFVPTTKGRLTLLTFLGVSACLLYVFLHIISPIHTSEYLDDDAVTRFYLWTRAWTLFTQSPVMGVGWGNFTVVFGIGDDPFFVPDQVAAHNIYLQLLAETGLVGFVVFSYLVFRSWKQALRLGRSSKDAVDRALAFGIQGALVAELVHGFVDFLFEADQQYGTLFWTLLALLVVSSRESMVTSAAPVQAGNEFGMGQPQAL
jgi:O-antigen ligase